MDVFSLSCKDPGREKPGGGEDGENAAGCLNSTPARPVFYGMLSSSREPPTQRESSLRTVESRWRWPAKVRNDAIISPSVAASGRRSGDAET